MPERNICSESGCKAYCCHDDIIRFEELAHEQLVEYWPGAKRTLSFVITELLKRKGVYFKKSGDGFKVKIQGRCPNIDEGFNCKLQENRPEPCLDFGVGQDNCTEVRLAHFLPPYREWAYYQRKSSKND